MCLFCKITNKEIPAEIIYEDEYALAFLDINPISPGHTVVISKKHVGNILELDNKLVCPLFTAVKKTAELLFKTLSPEGFTIGINHGKIAGQMIEHLHIHILPRFKNDGGGSIHAIVNNPPKETIKEITNRIKGFVEKSKP